VLRVRLASAHNDSDNRWLCILYMKFLPDLDPDGNPVFIRPAFSPHPQQFAETLRETGRLYELVESLDADYVKVAGVRDYRQATSLVSAHL